MFKNIKNTLIESIYIMRALRACLKAIKPFSDEQWAIRFNDTVESRAIKMPVSSNLWPASRWNVGQSSGLGFSHSVDIQYFGNQNFWNFPQKKSFTALALRREDKFEF